MPVTGIQTKTKDGEVLRLQFITLPGEEKGVHIDIYRCDENFIPVGKPEQKYEPTAEEESYHKALRQVAEEKAEFMPGYSSNPEWNPGYVPGQDDEEEHKEDYNVGE